MTEYTPEDFIKYRIERARETNDEVQTHIERISQADRRAPDQITSIPNS